jgi:hypothetical protein
MGFLDFFKSGVDPISVYEDSILGQLLWNDDDEAWVGRYNGYIFALAYDKQKEPDKDLINYARNILNSNEWLNKTLAEAKKNWLIENNKYAELLKDEIFNLEFDKIYFFKRKNINSILANLEGPSAERSWRIEFEDMKCIGLGYDT